MLQLSRRGLIGMLAAGVGAAIVRPGLIMPIKPTLVPTPGPLKLINNTGRMVFVTTTGDRLPVDTTAPDLIEAMTDTLYQGFGTDLRAGRFLADPDASHRLDLEFHRRGTTPWAMNDANRLGKAGSVHTIQRMFRGVPVDHFPVDTHGLPGVSPVLDKHARAVLDPETYRRWRQVEAKAGLLA